MSPGANRSALGPGWGSYFAFSEPAGRKDTGKKIENPMRPRRAALFPICHQPEEEEGRRECFGCRRSPERRLQPRREHVGQKVRGQMVAPITCKRVMSASARRKIAAKQRRGGQRSRGETSGLKFVNPFGFLVHMRFRPARQRAAC
jgi:hypothetical protein